MKTIKIFLASSSELESDRKEFEIFINRKNKEYVKANVFLELVLWEDFLDAMSQTRLQDEYNKAIAGCDVFVSLFHTKVGKYTEEEFLKALETFKANGKPLIYTYFKDVAINMSQITPDIMSLLNFKQKLNDLGHFYTVYADINDLKFKFSDQLTKFLPKLTNISPTQDISSANNEQHSDDENQTFQPENNSSREFWAKRLAAKQHELALVEAELEEERNLGNEDKLIAKAKRLLKEIEQINRKLI